MAIKKIEDEAVLKTTSLKTLRTAVEHKFTDEEKEALRKLTKEDERRTYIIGLYKKYIDEVVAEEEGKLLVLLPKQKREKKIRILSQMTMHLHLLQNSLNSERQQKQLRKKLVLL